MPQNTYTPIASVTLSATTSEVVFSGLPQTFRDLILVVDGTTTAGINGNVYFNGDYNGANYPYVRMYGDGSGFSSNTGTQIAYDFLSNRTMLRIQIMDYSATNKHKTLLSRWDTAQNLVGATAERWANTSAITSVAVRDTANVTSFVTGTTFTIFGVIA